MNIDNTGLFQFEFVDRQNEQAILNNFLCNHFSKVLWIYGKSGTGKSFFVQNCINHSNVIYVENKKESGAGSCILNLINQLHAISDSTFWQFVYKHFQAISAIMQDISPIKKLSESNFLQYAFSKNFYIIDKENKYNDLANVLHQYIEHTFMDSSLIFIIDNFDQCDENSVDILLNFAKYIIKDERKKFIFISTDHEYALSSNEKRLGKELPYKNLPIDIIPNENYFINMLPDQFDITNLKKDDIKRIYEVCQGIPEKLQDLLLNLNKARAIVYSNDKISFNLSIMEKYILSNEVADLKIDEFKPIEQCILLTIICIGMPLRMQLLLMLAQHIFKALFGFSFSEEKFKDALQEMIPKPLKMNFDSMNSIIYTDHDLTFGAALLYFKEKNMYKITCDIIYHFLQNAMIPEFISCFSETSQKELFANLSYNAQSSNWISLNLECGKYFYNNQNYIQATNYFNRFLDSMNFVSDEEKLFIVIANYECGLYKKAHKFLVNISEQSISQKYIYYIYAGKTHNMNGNYDLAEENFEKAIATSNKDSDEQMYAKYMLHLILTQIPGRWNDAETIYRALVEYIKQAYLDHDDIKFYQPSNAKILKCCYNFFFNQDSLKLMQMAEHIAEHLQMITEQAFILNNKGLEYIRQDDITNGINNFKRAYDILIKTKQHEAAYALNNIGICQMLNGDFGGAILSFKEASLYQKSYYLKLTIQTMLMQCYSLINNNKHEALANKLIDWVETHINEDPAIIRKIYMNLIIYSKRNNMIINAKNYLNKVIDKTKNTSSEYRALILQKDLFDIDLDSNKEFIFNESKYFNGLQFEPWFITLSHD